MAKFDFKQFLLAKGEKVALGVGLAGLGLFGVLGVMNAVSAESPSKVSSTLTGGAQNVKTKIANPNGTAPPLPEWVTSKGAAFREIDAEPFEAKANFFEPVDFPSRLRENPKVLGITTAQLDLVRAPMKAFDIRVLPDGSRQIGILSKVKIDQTSSKAVSDMLKNSAVKDRVSGQRPKPQNRPQPPGGLPGSPFGGGRGGMPGGPGGGGPGMPSAPGGPGGPGGAAGPGSPDGGMGGMMGSMFGGSGRFNQQGERFEATVAYVPVDEFDKRQGAVPAFTVYPLRMVVVHASFPLKEQLEEVKRALRLHNIEEARQLSIPGAAGATSGGLGSPAAPGAGAGKNMGVGGLGSPDAGGPGGPGGPAGGMGMSTGSAGGPIFAGFEVERRVTAPNGQRFDWAPYNHEDVYVDKIWSRKVADQPDDGYLSYFLRYDQMMAMPLPALAEGLSAYPEVRLPPIVAAVKKMKELAKPKIDPSAQQKKFGGQTGGQNPFLPQAGAGGGAGPAAGAGAGGLSDFLGNMGMAPGAGSSPASPGAPPGGYGGRGMQGPPPIGPGPGAGGRYGQGMQSGRGGQGMPMKPGGGPGMPYGPGMPGMPGGPNQYAQAPQTDTPEKDHLLLRFIDPDVQPGFTYQYRIRVKVKNPNFQRKDVGRPDDALHEILFGDWVRIDTTVTVTSELNLYAADPAKHAEKVREKYKDANVINLLDNKNGDQPVVQVQQWLEQVNIESKREPVGTWVVGDVPVQRGEFIGRKQVVSLPMWSAEKGTYILQELPRYKVWKAKEQPKGLLVDFSTPYILVDYEGGKVRPVVADRRVEDEASSEMLVLRPDGSLTVHSSLEDMADKDRTERNQKWEDWVKAVEEKTLQVGLPTQPGGDDSGKFQRGAGGSGSPDK